MSDDFEDSSFDDDDDLHDDAHVELNGQQLYTIEAQTKYALHIKQIKSLDEAGDVFYTADELKEMTGEQYFGTSQWVVMRKEVERALNELKSQLGPTKKSIIITDVELLEFLNGSMRQREMGEPAMWAQSVSYFVEGLRRVGNRLSLHETTAKKAKLNFRLVDKIISVGQWAVTKKLRPERKEGEYYALEFSIKYAYENRVGVLETLKKLITWADIEKELPEIDGFVELAKKVWDDPSNNMLVEKEVKSPT